MWDFLNVNFYNLNSIIFFLLQIDEFSLRGGNQCGELYFWFYLFSFKYWVETFEFHIHIIKFRREINIFEWILW